MPDILILHSDEAQGTATFPTSGTISKTPTTITNTIHSTAQAKFFQSSIYFNGVDAEIWYDDDWLITAGYDFTIDCWMYTASIQDTAVPWAQVNDDGSGGFMFRFTSSNSGLQAHWNNSTIDAPNFPLNQWVHVALIRSSGTITYYINGVSQGTITDSTALVDTDYGHTLGRNWTFTTVYWDGYLDELHINDDTAAYTANFTPPTVPYGYIGAVIGHTEGSPPGDFSGYVVNDFTGSLAPTPEKYYCDLSTLLYGRVRVPISKWQATLSQNYYSYLQATIPNPEQYKDAINDTYRFYIYKVGVLTNGQEVETIMANVNVNRVAYSKGTNNFSCVISGSATGALSAAGGGITRKMTAIRTITTSTTGASIRCAVDWLLKPNDIAVVNGENYTVTSLSYFVLGNDSYMDIKEQV